MAGLVESGLITLLLSVLKLQMLLLELATLMFCSLRVEVSDLRVVVSDAGARSRSELRSKDSLSLDISDIVGTIPVEVAMYLAAVTGEWCLQWSVDGA